MSEWAKSSQRFNSKDKSPTPGPANYEMKLAEDQNKHYGFLGKTLRFPPGHPEHGMIMFLIYILVSELAPAVEVPVSVVKKAPAKRSASLAEAQINKESKVTREEMSNKKTLLTQEERIAKLETSNAALVKDKSAIGTTVKQRERDIADLTRQNSMIKSNLEKSEKLNQSQLEKITASKVSIKKVEDLEKINARGVAIQEKMQQSIDTLTEKLETSSKSKFELSQENKIALKKIDDLEKMNTQGLAIQEKSQEKLADSLKCKAELGQEILDLKANNEKATKESQFVSGRVGELEASIVKCTGIEEAQTAEISELKSSRDSMMIEKSALSTRLADMEVLHDNVVNEMIFLEAAHASQVEESKKSIENQEMEKQTLAGHLATRDVELSSSQELIESLKNDNSLAINGMEKAHGLVVGEIEERLLSIETEKKTLSESLELINGELSNEKALLLSQQEDINVLKCDLDASSEKSASLQSSMAAMEQSNIASIASMTSEHEESSGKMSKIVADLEISRDSLEERNQELAGQLGDVESQLEACESDLDASRFAMEEYVASSDVAQSKLVESFDALKSSTDTVERMEAQIVKLSGIYEASVIKYQEKIGIAEEKISVMESTIEDLESDLGDNSKEIGRITLELSEKIAAFEVLNVAHESVKSMLASANDDATVFAEEARKKGEELKSQIIDLESCFEKSSEKILYLEMEKEGLNGELSSSQKSIESLQSNVDENVIALQQASDLRLQLEGNITEKGSKIDDLQGNYADATESIQSLEVEIQDMKISSSTEIAGLEQMLASTKSELGSEIEVHVNTIESHISTIESLKSDVVGLETKVTDMAEIGAELEKNLEDARARNDMLEMRVGSLKGDAVGLESKVSSLDESCADLEKNLEDARASNDELGEVVASLKSDVAGLESKVTSMAEVCADLEKNLEDSGVLNVELEEVVKFLKGDIDELESKVSSMTEVCANLEKSLENSRETNVELEEVIDSLKGDVVGLESKVSGLVEVGAGLEKSLVDANERNVELEADVGQRKSLLFEAAQQKQALENEIADLEGRLASVEGVYSDTLAAYESYKLSMEARVVEMDETLSSDHARFEATLSNAKKDNATVLADLESHHADNLEAMQAAVDRVSTSLKEKTQESDSQSDMISSLSRDISELKFVYETKTKDWEAEKASLDVCISQLESVNSEMESKVGDISECLEDATSQLSITTKNLVETESANKDVNNRFMKSQNEITELLSSMEVEREKSRLSIGELSKANQSLTDSNSLMQQNHILELDYSKKVNDNLLIEKESIKDLLSVSENNMVNAELKMEMIESKNIELVQVMKETLLKTAKDMEVEREGHQEQISSMNESVMDLTSRSQASQDQLEKMQTEKTRMESLIHMLEMKNSTEVSGKETQIRSLQDQVANTAAKLEAQKEEMSNLVFVKHENKSMLYDLDMIKSENAALERKVHDVLANDQHDRRSMRSQLETRLAEINILKSERDRLKKDITEGGKKSQKLLDKANHEVKLAKAKEDFVTNELLKASEDQSGQIGHNNAKQKIKLFSQLKEDNVKMKKEIEATKLSQDESRRKIGTLEREIDTLKSLQSTGGKVMSKAQRMFRERQTVDIDNGEGKEN